MSSFFKKLKPIIYHRRLQIHILTLFMTLLIVSSAIIIWFFYQRNTQSILEFSKGTIQRASDSIRQKTICLVRNVQHLPELLTAILADREEISLQDEDLKAMLFAMIEYYPDAHRIFIGTPNGNFIDIVDLTLIGFTHLQTEPSKPLPQGIKYGFHTVDRSNKENGETWVYKDSDFKTLAEESLPVAFDPRVRPWYKRAQKGKLYWSDIFVFEPSKEPGITVSKPIYNKQGKLIGVGATSMTLSAISTFLAEQRVSKSGQAFIFDNSGKIIVPPGVTNAAADAAYAQFKENPERNFVFQLNGKKYLAHAHDFPVKFEKEWLILMVAPLNDFFGTIFKALRDTVLIGCFIVLLSGLIVVYFSKRVSKPIVDLTKEVDKIKRLDLASEKRVHSHIREITLLDNSIAAMRVMLRSFGRYVPKEIVRQLMEKGQEIALGGTKKEITVFFSDIADFTTLAESHEIEDVMPPLENYFDTVSKIILSSQGTIDKYIGDGIMAFWGAPKDIEDQTIHACTAALLCQKALNSFNLNRRKEQKPEFLTRIGLHVGSVIVGNIGTTERMNYTAMGDVVNEASRLQQVNKIYHTSILVSDEVYRKVNHAFLFRPLDEVLVKGKRKKIKIYELVAKFQPEQKEIAPKKEQIELCESFSVAYKAYSEGKLDEAKALFNALHERFPQDYPTIYYIKRMEV